MKHFAAQSLIKTTYAAFILFFAVNNLNADEPACGNPHGEISRAVFTTEVKDREPVNQVLILDSTYNKVYFFTDLRHFEGRDVIHRWEHDGHVVSQKVFSVKGPRWRVYSTMALDKSMTGRWTVVVTDKQGCPIKAVIFEYVAAGTGGNQTAIIDLKTPE